MAEGTVLREKQEQPDSSTLDKDTSFVNEKRLRKYIINKKSDITLCKDVNVKSTLLIPKKKILVLDLDETLIHSSFEPLEKYSMVLTIPQENCEKTIYVNKRPYLDEFLWEMGKLFEIYIFTAGLRNYANTVIDEIDKYKVIKKRYYRDDCTYYNGLYIKDLNIIGKSLNDVITVDNSPYCYCLNPNNAVPIDSFFDDFSDIELFNLIPLLTSLSHSNNVQTVLKEMFNNDLVLSDEIVQDIRRQYESDNKIKGY